MGDWRHFQGMSNVESGVKRAAPRGLGAPVGD